jgi:hypothetical protein
MYMYRCARGDSFFGNLIKWFDFCFARAARRAGGISALAEGAEPSPSPSPRGRGYRRKSRIVCATYGEARGEGGQEVGDYMTATPGAPPGVRSTIGPILDHLFDRTRCKCQKRVPELGRLPPWVIMSP